MRVLLWIGSLHTGGAERQFALLADGLLREGVEAKLATMIPGGSNWDRFAVDHPDHLISLNLAPPRTSTGSSIQHMRAPIGLRALIREFRPHVVYSALHLSNAIAWVSTRAGGPPLVWSVRASNAMLNPKRAIPFQFCKATARTVPLAIANAQAGRQYYRQRGFRPRRFEIVGNGIDTDRFRPDDRARTALREEWGIGPERPVIGAVSRIVSGKGHEILLTAARHVVDLSPEVLFIIAGGGPPALQQRLASMTRRLGLERHVRWLGHQDDAARLYPAFDVFCSPSTSEGFPNSVAEAMASGLGCVVTDAGDSALIVGGTGHVVPVGDAGSLARGLLLGLDQFVRGDGDADARRRRITTMFSVDQMVRQTHDLLSSVVEERVEHGHGARR